MVSKIKEDNSFGGNYTEDRVDASWNTTTTVYEGVFLKPIYNGSDWIESATTEEVSVDLKDKEYDSYIVRREDGTNRYLRLCAEYRYLKNSGAITLEFYRILEETLKSVREEIVLGQFISAKEKLEEIGSSVITQDIYNAFHSSIVQAIDELYD